MSPAWLAVMVVVSGAPKKPGFSTPRDIINRLEAIANEHLLDALIIYELASRVSPQVVLTLSDKERAQVRTYVERYVLTRAADEPSTPP